MIGFFPKIYEDELLYSQIARYHRRSGNVRFRFTVDEIYLHRTVIPSIEFVNQYTDDAFSWITKNEDWETVIWKHTMLPAYIRFLPKDRKQKAFKAVHDCVGTFNNIIYIPNKGERFFRYCPECAKEDRNKYGETYWHRKHQILKVNVCPSHNCYLENSSIAISGKMSPNLYDAESCVPNDLVTRQCTNETEIKLAEYILDVFDSPVDMESNQSAGSYLNSKLSEKYKKRGLVRQITELYEDIKKAFDNVPVMTSSQMQKVYNGSFYDMYFICQIAMFEGIAPRSLVQLPRVDNLSEIGDLYEKLSERFDIDYEIVATIGDEVCKYNYEHNRIHRHTGRLTQNYLVLDDETLPLVKDAVQQVLNRDGRPQQVSITKIEKLLGLPQKRIANLPKCKEYIQQHMETQAEYWGREVCWAIYQIIDNERPIHWTNIRRLTNMRPSDLIACLPYIKDEEVKKIVEKIVTDFESKL